PKNDRWLKHHANVHFHFTPTRASWLNQIEIWFSILADQSLAGVSFNSVVQLRSHIDAFIEDYNEHAKPFAWTKSHVHQHQLKARLAAQGFRVLEQNDDQGIQLVVQDNRKGPRPKWPLKRHKLLTAVTATKKKYGLSKDNEALSVLANRPEWSPPGNYRGDRE